MVKLSKDNELIGLHNVYRYTHPHGCIRILGNEFLLLTKVLFIPVFSYLLFHLFSLSWSVGWNKAAEGLSLKRSERERERRCNHATSLRALFAASFGSRGRSVQTTILLLTLEDVRYLAINLNYL